MTKALSTDLRERVVLAVESGQSRRSAATRFGVAASTAVRWVDSWRQTGRLEPLPRGGDNRSHRIEAHGDEILKLIDANPELTLAEVAAHLEENHGLKVAQSTVWRFFRRHGITVTKSGPRQRRTAR